MSYVGDLVDALKRPAIEAYVASMPGFMGSGTVDGTDFKGVERSATGYMVERDNLYLIISPPDSSGHGGGRLAVWNYAGGGGLYTVASEVSSWSEPREFVHEFDEVRARIDRAFSKWLDLPQALRFDVQVDSAASALRRLQVDLEQVQSWLAGGAYPEYQMASSLSMELATVGRILSDESLFAGLTLDTVKERYASGAQLAVAGLYAMSTVCGGHIAAERSIWANARHDLFSIISSGHDGFVGASARDNGIGWGPLLTVLGVAVKGMSLIATATGAGAVPSLALGGVGLAIEQLKDTASGAVTEEARAIPATYAGVMSAIETSLTDLAAAIRREESLIASNIDANLDHILDDASKYDLTGAIFVDDDPRDLQIRFDTTSAPSVSVAMRAVSAELDAATGYFAYMDVTTACSRDSSIGLGATGPASKIAEFATMIEGLLNALSVEFSRGADNWDGATQLFMEQENAAMDIVKIYESQIDLTPFADIDEPPSIVDPLLSDAESGAGRNG